MEGKDLAVWGAMGTLFLGILTVGTGAAMNYSAQAARQEEFREKADEWHAVVAGKIDRFEELNANLRVELAEVRQSNLHLQAEVERLRDEHGAQRTRPLPTALR